MGYFKLPLTCRSDWEQYVQFVDGKPRTRNKAQMEVGFDTALTSPKQKFKLLGGNRWMSVQSFKPHRQVIWDTLAKEYNDTDISCHVACQWVLCQLPSVVSRLLDFQLIQLKPLRYGDIKFLCNWWENSVQPFSLDMDDTIVQVMFEAGDTIAKITMWEGI